MLERVGDAIRFNPELLAFAAHHCFEPRPVAIARGNEKGRVDRSIRYIREAFFAAREFADLDDLNAQARVWCEGQASDRRWPEDGALSVREAFEAERASLLALPDTDRLSHAAPAALELLKAAAARGHNLGAITAALLRLLERYGAAALQAAIGEALQRDVPHPNAVRLALERAREEQGLPPPTALCLSEEVARRDAPVRSHELASYDRIVQAVGLRLHGLLAHWSEVMADADTAQRVTQWPPWTATRRCAAGCATTPPPTSCSSTRWGTSRTRTGTRTCCSSSSAAATSKRVRW